MKINKSKRDALRSTTQDSEQVIDELRRRIETLRTFLADDDTGMIRREIDQLTNQIRVFEEYYYKHLSPWKRVQLARDLNRPSMEDFIKLLCTNFIELHGDRNFGDDKAILCGLATFEGQSVLVVGNRKGKTTQERMACHFGCAHPEGFRKALKKMELSEKFALPILSFVNTPGAYPGIGAEERGQAFAIAENIRRMSSLRVPVIVMVIGEGGSGGALGIGVGDRILILENAYFSVISPEGCAAILWKDGSRAKEAAQALKITAPDLYNLGLVDEIVPEPLGGAHRNYEMTAQALQEVLSRHLKELQALSVEELLERRYAKHRVIGKFSEPPLPTSPEVGDPLDKGESSTKTGGSKIHLWRKEPASQGKTGTHPPSISRSPLLRGQALIPTQSYEQFSYL